MFGEDDISELFICVTSEGWVGTEDPATDESLPLSEMRCHSSKDSLTSAEGATLLEPTIFSPGEWNEWSVLPLE